MKKLIVLFLTFVLALSLSVPAFAAEVATADLITDGGDITTATDVGDLSVDYTSGNITVSYAIDISTGWEIVETHVYVGTTAPKKHSPGKFPYVADEPVVVPDGALIYIAAHAEIMRDTGLVDEYDQPIYETAWAQWQTVTPSEDTLFRGNSGSNKGNAWATFFTVTVP